MSDESTGQTRHAQADELIRALHRNTVAVGALAAGVAALVLAVERNTKVLEEMVEEDEHAEDCEDDDCDGECLDEPEPAPPRRKKR